MMATWVLMSVTTTYKKLIKTLHFVIKLKAISSYDLIACKILKQNKFAPHFIRKKEIIITSSDTEYLAGLFFSSNSV